MGIISYPVYKLRTSLVDLMIIYREEVSGTVIDQIYRLRPIIMNKY